jgi:hypothetical protein
MTPEQTIQRLRDLTANATESPWVFDGRDIFSKEIGDNGHRLIIPLPETWHESQQVNKVDATLIVAARNHWDTLLDIAEAAHSFDKHVALNGGCHRGCPEHDALNAALARLTNQQDT